MSFSSPPPSQNQFGGDFAPAPYQQQYVERPGDSLQSGPRKSFLATWLLSLFFGNLGVDRFYLGKIGTGVAKLLTFGGFGFWSIIDLILILAGKMTDKNDRPLDGYRQHKAKAIAITIAMWVVSIIFGIVFALLGVAAAQSVHSANVAKAQGESSAVVPAPESTYSSGVAGDGKELGNVTGNSFEVDTDGGRAKITVGKVAYVHNIDDTSNAKNGGYLIMQVQWETVSGKTTASPANFSAFTSDGTPGDMAFAPEKELQTRELNAGEVANGYVAFDIKRGDTTIEVYNDKLDKIADFSLAAPTS